MTLLHETSREMAALMSSSTLPVNPGELEIKISEPHMSSGYS